MAVVTSEVAKLLGQSSNNNVPPNQSSSENFRNLCQDYLAGRVVAFMAYVMPQLQNLIVTSVAGLLLMLLAFSSYPFQPHAVLLLFDWGVVLFFIAVAMLVFIQMNRDPVLSNLNGTAPGKLSWDWEFVSRIIVYALIPLTTLLGAQFPQSASQLFTHILPGSGGHP